MRAEATDSIGWTAAELAADPSWRLWADRELERGLGALMDWAMGREDPEEALVRQGGQDGAWGGSAPLLRRWCAPLVAQLEQGRGVARVTGLAGLGEGELRLLFLAVGLMLGHPDRTYGLLYGVRDSGLCHRERPIPVSQTRAATGMHTDSSRRDVHPRWVGLACVRPAAWGGESAVASARAISCHLLQGRPDVVARLRRPFIRDVVTPGGERHQAALRANAFPILAGPPRDPTLRYMRHWIETGQRQAGEPLSLEALADLDTLDAALNAPRFRHDFQLERGDLLFVDNHRMAHGRTAYGEDPEQPRLMLRLWLNTGPACGNASPANPASPQPSPPSPPSPPSSRWPDLPDLPE